MNWQNILEGIIGNLIATCVSGVVGAAIYKLGRGGKFLKNQSQKGLKLDNFTPFSLSLIITTFFTILSTFSFYYQWANMPYMIVITGLIWFGTFFIYDNQCPSCNKIFKKKHVDREKLGEEKIPHEYYDEIIYKYSDGSFKDRVWGKKKKRWVEIVRTIRDHFVCRSCGHKWNSSIKRITVNESDRPKPIIRMTRIKNPEGLI